MRDAEFNQLLRFRNQPVIAASNFGGGQLMSSIEIPLFANYKNERLKLVHKLVEFLDHPNKKTCVTVLQCNLDKPERSFAQVRLFGIKKKEENFQQIVEANC